MLNDAAAGVHQHWLAIASLGDVQAFRENGKVRLRKLGLNKAFCTHPGDRIAFFSSSSPMGILQAFSGIATLRTSFSQVRTHEGLHYEAEVDFAESHLVKMKLLVRRLSFIQDPNLWSRDMPQVMDMITRADFDLLAAAMGVEATARATAASSRDESQSGATVEGAAPRITSQSGSSMASSNGSVGPVHVSSVISLRSQSRTVLTSSVGAAASASLARSISTSR